MSQYLISRGSSRSANLPRAYIEQNPNPMSRMKFLNTMDGISDVAYAAFYQALRGRRASETIPVADERE